MAVEPVRGRVPLRASKAIVASAKMSVAGVQGTGCACSGAMYAGCRGSSPEA